MAPRFLLLATVAALILSGCKRPEIKTYRVAKDSQAQAQTSQLPPNHPAVGSSDVSPMTPPAPGPAQAELSWTPAAHWQSKALGQMRKGSYAIKGDANTEADLSIFVFPGAAGGLIDNINRWRGQVALQPIDAETMAKERVEITSDSGLKLVMVDMTGTSGDRILGAVLEGPVESWFFKLKGPQPLLEKEKAAFVTFLKSVKRN